MKIMLETTQYAKTTSARSTIT